MSAGNPDLVAADREAAKLRECFPEAWKITYRAYGDLVIFTATRPGLVLSKPSAEALEAELAMWEAAPNPD